MRAPTSSLLLFIVASGCVTPGPPLRREALKSTRRVAIVGFSGVLKLGDAPVQESLWEAVVKPGAHEREKKELEERRARQALRTCEALRAQLAALDWAPTPLEATQSVVSSSRLSAAPDGSAAISGLPSARQLNRSPAVERAFLARALAVDALLSVEVEFRAVEKSGFTLAGLGNLNHRLIALTTVRIFDASGELAWEEREVRGNKTNAARSALAPDATAEDELFAEAARSSFEALINRLLSAR